MKGAFRIGSYRNIGVYIHWTFLLLLLWVGGNSFFDGSTVNAIAEEIGFLLMVFFCVLLHEFGHALSAARYGIPTKDITLLPIGGLARLEKIPEKPWHELVVAIAGPAVNVGIIIILALVMYFGKGLPLGMDIFSVDSNSFLVNLLLVNISLVVFNMIPAFPMDGGRILRSLLAMKLTKVKATLIAVRIGQVISIGFVVLGWLYSPMLILIGIFIFFGAKAELKYTIEAEQRARMMFVNYELLNSEKENELNDSNNREKF
ncbi:MAG: site-2 protease family protein [Bacteroidia bacterium]|jgi:Zn-dependent protease|nr:site-2 protease family protein [Bacteroidota bacterium]MBP6512264.1 site-2 protease family protein [Bacteroidia bacterium]MBP7244767.1 site-2 protease family protein [Bacteroidia bacterium]